MLVRLAHEADLPDIVEMARLNMAETRPELPFSEEVCRDTFAQYLATAAPTIWVVEQQRRPIGFMLAEIRGFRASSGFSTAQEVLFVRPDKRGTRAAVLLMKNFLAWSVRLGAVEINGGNDNDFNSERTARFLEHFGFRRVGFAMRRDIH
jgi:L-amino acid N-acyltransferase YncA